MQYLEYHYAIEVNEFLAQMTECNKDGIFIIAATNRPEKIDPTSGKVIGQIDLTPLTDECKNKT